ncbi:MULTISPECIES: type II toxin-antitoxin system ParD family antitoxin [unclassified Xanthobacter]|uniref:type II toxin-antitoxin system ParD family antitoxin n=1 Tax=unclassified Xanthobacter TaxID=2623496 RepID=UPI001EE10BDD|nr:MULTISPECIES: type II toxin-antitoxin system ParD family antitoxin [unclassified Xanthobacter]
MSDRFALSPEHSGLIDRFVSSGRFDGPHAVLSAALSLLEARERERSEKLSALHSALAAEAGKLAFDVDETFREIERLIGSGLGAPGLREAC